MKAGRGMQGVVLIGFVVVSLALYWAADSANTLATVLLLGVLAALALVTVWNHG